MNDVLTFVQIVQLLLDVAGKIGAGVDETLDTEEKALPSLKVDPHGPECDFKFDNLPDRYLFLLFVRVERDQVSASLRILCAMRCTENPSWAGVLYRRRSLVPFKHIGLGLATHLDGLGHWYVVLGIDSFWQRLPGNIDVLEDFAALAQLADGHVDVHVVLLIAGHPKLSLGVASERGRFVEFQDELGRLCMVAVGLVSNRALVGLR